MPQKKTRVFRDEIKKTQEICAKSESERKITPPESRASATNYKKNIVNQSRLFISFGFVITTYYGIFFVVLFIYFDEEDER